MGPALGELETWPIDPKENNGLSQGTPAKSQTIIRAWLLLGAVTGSAGLPSLPLGLVLAAEGQGLCEMRRVGI